MLLSHRRRFTPVLDHLEHRNLLAGNVSVAFNRGYLDLLGDAETNQIRIVSDTRNTVTITSLDDTTLNGTASTLTFRKVQGLTAFMRDGDDVVDISNAHLAKSWFFYLQGGNDTFFMDNVKMGSKSILSLGEGDDTTVITNATIKEKAQILSGAGFDALIMDNVRLGERSIIDMGADDDIVEVTNSTISERLQFVSGAGNDMLTMSRVRAGERTVLNLGADNDIVTITDSTFSDRFQLLAGTGDDRASLGTTRIGERSQLDGGAGVDDLGLVGNRFGKRMEIAFWATSTNSLLPTAVADSATVSVGGEVLIDLAGNDIAPSGFIDATSIVIVNDPVSGTVVVNGDGTVTYTHDGSATTTDSFSYTVLDSQGNVTNVATVTVTVEQEQSPPAANDDFIDILQGAAVIIPISDNDVPVTGTLDLTSIVIVSPPSSGSVIVNGDGSVTYTHNGSATTSDSFTYTITDSFGNISNEGTVFINIAGGALVI